MHVCACLEIEVQPYNMGKSLNPPGAVVQCSYCKLCNVTILSNGDVIDTCYFYNMVAMATTIFLQEDIHT